MHKSSFHLSVKTKYLNLLWFCITTLCDWLKKKLAPLSQPIRTKTKTKQSKFSLASLLLPIHMFCFKVWLHSSLDCLCLLWLTRAITLVLFLRHSVENRLICSCRCSYWLEPYIYDNHLPTPFLTRSTPSTDRLSKGGCCCFLFYFIIIITFLKEMIPLRGIQRNPPSLPKLFLHSWSGGQTALLHGFQAKWQKNGRHVKKWKYSGTPINWSLTGQKDLAVLTRWP